MKAKLIKIKDGYELFTQGFLKGSTNHNLIDSLNVEEGNTRYKLSLKNCQAIERGWDLDELAKIEYPICEVWNDEEALIRELAFKKGFQKALELMGDKKFSEEDLMEAYSRGQTNSPIQSLKQTEWDVEIETVPALSNNGNVYYGDIPKLDATGCLILKRI